MYIAHPVDWRYGSEEMRKLLSPENIVSIYANIEALVAQAQAEIGIIPMEVAEDIKKATEKVSLSAVLEEEKKTKHDIVALINVISKKCSLEESKRFIHWGLTSQDIKDTAFAYIIRKATMLIENRLIELIRQLIKLAEEYAEVPCVGRTHGVHGNIYSLGHKFAVFADEFLRHLKRLDEGKSRFLTGKLSGAVGLHIIMGEKGLEVEKRVMNKLGLYPSQISTQVVPRDRYAEFFLILSLISSSLDRLATEIRNLHRTEIGEVLEGFEPGQRGSSAMPHKKNPINSENISSLSRILRGLVVPVLENIVLWHERDLTNSASERVLLADYLLLLDEQLLRANKVLRAITINRDNIRKNLELSHGLIFSELIMYKLIEMGYSRVKAHSKVLEWSEKVLKEKKHILDVIREEGFEGYSEIEKILKEPVKYLAVAKKLIQELKKEIETYLETKF